MFMVLGKHKLLLTLFILVIIVVGGCALYCSSHRCYKPTIHKNVLVIQSDEVTCKDYTSAEDDLKKYFLQQGIDADIHSEYLDCEHLLTAEEEKRMYEIVDSQKNWKPDIVM